MTRAHDPGHAVVGADPSRGSRRDFGRRWRIPSGPAYAGLFLLGIFLVLGACAGQPQKPIRLGVSLWPGYDPLLWGRERGYLEPGSVKLVEYPSTSQSTRAFRNGAIDAVAGTLDGAIKLRAVGVDLAIVLVFDFSAGADVILGRPPVNSIADLRHRKVGLETTSIGDYVLVRALESAGMTVEDVQVVPMEVSEHERAFREGRVDAVVTYEPFRTRLLASGARRIFDSSEMPGEIVDVLMVRPDVIARSGPQLRHLLAGWFRAIDDIRRGDGDAIGFLARREAITVAEVTASLNGLELSDPARNRALLCGPAPGLVGPARRVESYMRKKGLIDDSVDVGSVLVGDPVEWFVP
jgi:NitT/TauT family transport system substrate-binding protein